MTEEQKTIESSSSQVLEDGEEVLPLADIIKQQDDLMEEVAAVLGAGDDYNCSYNNGYMKRQALYACLTCVPQGKEDFSKAAGVCLACSHHCHDGHNLVELYTKRHFRCDCGNKKFGDIVCNLNADKDDCNLENEYNQNFSGVYCTCHKPYPDPEDPIEDDMIQCIICEDWYHSRHLNAACVEDFAEMICETCVKTHGFLMNYIGMAVVKVEPAKVDEHVNIISDVADVKETNGEVKKEGTNESNNKGKLADSKPETAEKSDVTPTTEEGAKKTENDSETNGKDEENDKTEEHLAKTTETGAETTEQIEKSEKSKETPAPDSAPSESTNKPEEIPPEKMETENLASKCTKPILKDQSQARTLFMKVTKWRQNLCKCDDCLALYKEHKVEYLLDMEDTVELYENKGKESYQEAKKQAIEAEQQILKNMPRAPLLNAIAGYNEFKEQLVDYLKQIAEAKKVLTVDDVKEFFSKLNSNKRQKLSESTYMCR